ncbi:MAG: preprotein translocase subunit SecG [Verrucomicrobiae bacterium]|nr:preprotein translocase subunit SecG [Verrucomicrobiae bacterium]
MSILIGFLLTIHVITCIFLVLIILMQRPKNEGLGTAFGSGLTDSFLGASAGNVLAKITTWLGVIFFITTILLAYIYSHRQNEKSRVFERIKAASAASTNAQPGQTVSNAAPAAVPQPVAPVAAETPKPAAAPVAK